MKELLELTLWTMNEPKSYGPFHIICSLILLSLAVLLALFFRNSNEKAHKRIMICCSVILFVFEVYKISIHYFFDPYDWGVFGVFPLQLCSMPMYLCFLCALPFKEKFKSYLYEFMFAVNMFGGAIAFVEPSGINHPYITLTMHAYIWHALIVFVGLYLYFSKRACKGTIKEYYKIPIVYLVCCGVAQTFNIIFRDKKLMNAFFISPYDENPLIVFNSIQENAGWLVCMILYMIATMLAALIVYSLGLLFRNIKNKKNLDIEKAQ